MIEVSTEKRTENFCNNALRALMQFSVLFWLIPRSIEKIFDSFLILCNIYQNDGVTVVLFGQKIKVIFASAVKLYCAVICISTTSKVGNNPVFKRVRIIDFLPMKIINLIFFRLIEVTPDKRTENCCNFPSFIGWYRDQQLQKY